MPGIVKALVVLGVVLQVGATASPLSSLRVHPITYVGVPIDQQAVSDWAIGLFHAGGLDLPPLTIRHHGSQKECFGRNGAYHRVEGEFVIEICFRGEGPYLETLFLHEIAHAWTEWELTSERRVAFQQLRGWRYWNNYQEVAWHENGAEQAADIIVWGLLDRPIKPIRINQNTCADLMAGYMTLTGRIPLHGYLDLCDLSISELVES